MKRETVLFLCLAFLVTVAVASWAMLSPTSAGEHTQTAPPVQQPDLRANQGDPGLLKYPNCLRDCGITGIDQDPEATGSCLVLFHVFHLIQDGDDPDCCIHEAPDTVKLLVHPLGALDEEYTVGRTGPLWWEPCSCYVYNYEKTLSCQNHQTYLYRFYHAGQLDCECPPFRVYASTYVDCDD